MLSNVPHSEETCAQVNGIEVVYDTFGEPDAPPALLIMGLGGQMIGWRDAFCAQLAAHGLWVIRFDNRDAGLSTRFEGAETPSLRALVWAALRGKPIDVPYTLSDMADDAVGLLDWLAIDAAHVVGISLGGMIAQTTALEHPERVRTLTSMLSTSDPRFPPPKPRARILLKGAPRDQAGFVEHSLRVHHTFRGSRFPLDEAHVRDGAARAYERCAVPSGSGRQIAAVLASGSRKDRLASVTAPALVIHGAEDSVLPVAQGIATARAIPGSALMVIHGLGHELPPAVWTEVIEAIAWHTRGEQRIDRAWRSYVARDGR
jgi:pimeloyl-ACP methyl ester carboxylesterase